MKELTKKILIVFGIIAFGAGMTLFSFWYHGALGA
jgi:hypothetical protein